MATITPSWASAATISITLASLATSSTFVAGREATAVDNSSNKYDDMHISGKITVGTSPTASTQIRVYLLQGLDETPNWPDVFDGTDSVETLTSVGNGRQYLKLAAVLDVDSTSSDIGYPVDIPSVAAIFDGAMPRNLGVFVTHNTGVALNSTSGNHNLKYVGIKYDVA